MRPRTDGSTLVYNSEDPRRAPTRKGRPAPKGAPQQEKLDGIVRVWLERKGRNGKPVSIIRGLATDDASLAALASRLKRVCGTGGSAKNGEIIIQGDHRSRIASELERDGHRVKLAGG